jgi:hypothetical protein
MFAGATIVAAIMIVTVSAGLALLAWTTPALVESVWTLAFIAGICAATSLTLPAGTPLEPQSPTTRIIEAGVVLPISAGGLLLAWLHTGAPAATLVLLAQAFGVTLALATAGWLVLTRVSSPTEERVFALSALLLIGGAADALVLSALLAGLTAGVFWRLAGGRPREIVGRDVLFVQHSLLVLVLLVAGATAEISLASIAVGGLYTLLRILGAFAGGAVARRVIDGRASGDLSRHLLRPGVFGVAFAVNAAGLTTEAQGSLLLTGIVVGTIGAEVAARFLWSSPSNP